MIYRKVHIAGCGSLTYALDFEYNIATITESDYDFDYYFIYNQINLFNKMRGTLIHLLTGGIINVKKQVESH